MRIKDLKSGVSVRFTQDAGLVVGTSYKIHSVDLQSHTVRLDGVRGSYSIDHIEGIQLVPDGVLPSSVIPASEAGLLADAVLTPTGIPRDLPSREKTPKDASLPIVELPGLDPLEGLDVVSLLDAMEHHLHKLAEHPDPAVKYHARSALRIQWHLETGGGANEAKKEESASEEPEPAGN